MWMWNNFPVKSCVLDKDNFLVPGYRIDIIAFIGIKDEQDIEFEEVGANRQTSMISILQSSFRHLASNVLLGGWNWIDPLIRKIFVTFSMEALGKNLIRYFAIFALRNMVISVSNDMQSN